VSSIGMLPRARIIFSCSFSYRIWRTCLQCCNSLSPPLDWSDLINEGCKKWKTKALMGVLCRLILSSTVYGLWRARNKIKFSRHPRTDWRKY